MRVLLSRRTRNVLLTLSALLLLAAPCALAKNPYALRDATEGDPGDGVLSPVAPELRPVSVPEDLDVLGTTDSRAARRAPRASRVHDLPLTLWAAGLGWVTLTPLLWLAGRSRYAP